MVDDLQSVLAVKRLSRFQIEAQYWRRIAIAEALALLCAAGALGWLAAGWVK